MCCRYYIDDDTYEELRNIVSEVDKKLNSKSWNQDIHPMDLAPVMLGGAEGMCLAGQSFGYPVNRSAGLLLNARAESVYEKPMFTAGIRSRRAVIPARSFYEWNDRKEKYTFSRTDSGILFFAGMYDLYGNAPHFVIITTAANASMKKIHDRMPLILEQEQIEEWLYSEKEAKVILQQTPVLLRRDVEYEQMTLF